MKSTYKTLFKSSKLGKTINKVTTAVGNIAGKTAVKVAAEVGLGFLDVGLSIWTIVDNVDKLKGNEEARVIREGTERLNVVHATVTKIFKDVHQNKSCTIIAEGNSSTTLALTHAQYMKKSDHCLPCQNGI